MILVVNVCKERLHYYEFVKPVEDILSGREVLVRHYNEIEKEDLEKCERVIICGTSLKDNGFLEDLDKFDWLKDFDKPVLGVCAGFQILGLVVCGGKLKKNVSSRDDSAGPEIGFFRERFENEFLGLKGETEVYHLHGNYVEFGSDVEIFCEGDFVQAFRKENFYGVLFHPEVRNKEMILEFCGL